MPGIAIELRGECSGCGSPLPINAFVPQIGCPACNRIVDIAGDTWGSLLEDAIKEGKNFGPGDGRSMSVMTGGGTFNVLYGKQEARCDACKTDVAMRFVQQHAQQRGYVACVGCGKWVSARPVPAGLDPKVFRSVLYVVGEDTTQFQTGQGSAESQPAAEPVLFTCPSCGGSLKVDGTARTIACTFCKSNLYLPDDLWRRMHPVKTVQRWYLWYDDQPPPGFQYVDVRVALPPAAGGKAEVQTWQVEAGQSVRAGQKLVSLEYGDEKEVTVTAPAAGVVLELLKDTFDDVTNGEILCRIQAPAR